tara:strand:- start:1263 stop:2030 length:768 start_codon:yes stop_codon:yes gene_type:complete
MSSNNPFETHNIGHLSASSINTWVTDPAKWVATYLCGLSSKAGPAAWRGIATEHAMHKRISNPDLPYRAVEEMLYSKFDEFHMDTNAFASDKVAKERYGLINYYTRGMELYSTLGEATSYQEKVVIDFEELSVPFVGYIDFIYPNQIRDTKTVARMVSGFTEGASRQLAIYAQKYPDYEVWVDYITPKEARSYKMAQGAIDYRMKESLKIAYGIQKFLSISNDSQELASMFYPDYDSWMWSSEMKHDAQQKIWRV